MKKWNTKKGVGGVKYPGKNPLKRGRTLTRKIAKSKIKLLIDREIKIKDLAQKAGISQATLAKMKRDGATVSSDVLVKICTALGCQFCDIMEIIEINKESEDAKEKAEQ